MKIKTFFSDWQEVGDDMAKVLKLYKHIFQISSCSCSATKKEYRKEIFPHYFKDVDFETVDKLAMSSQKPKQKKFKTVSKQITEQSKNQNSETENQNNKSSFFVVPDTQETRKTVNFMARKKEINRLMRDILVDMQICELENWDKKEYLLQLDELITSFTKKIKKVVL